MFSDDVTFFDFLLPLLKNPLPALAFFIVMLVMLRFVAKTLVNWFLMLAIVAGLFLVGFIFFEDDPAKTIKDMLNLDKETVEVIDIPLQELKDLQKQYDQEIKDEFSKDFDKKVDQLREYRKAKQQNSRD